MMTLANTDHAGDIDTNINIQIITVMKIKIEELYSSGFVHMKAKIPYE